MLPPSSALHNRRRAFFCSTLQSSGADPAPLGPRRSSYHQPYRYLAACYAHMGKLDDAREMIARLRAISPTIVPDVSYLRSPRHRELYLSGLRLAMCGG